MNVGGAVLLGGQARKATEKLAADVALYNFMEVSPYNYEQECEVMIGLLTGLALLAHDRGLNFRAFLVEASQRVSTILRSEGVKYESVN